MNTGTILPEEGTQGSDRYRGGNGTGDCVHVSPIIADARDRGRQVCVMLGSQRQGEGAGAGAGVTGEGLAGWDLSSPLDLDLVLRYRFLVR